MLIEKAATLQMMGRLQEALGLYDQVEPIYRQIEDRDGLGRCLNGKGIVFCLLGRVDEGIRLMREGEVLLAAVENRNMLLQSRKNRAAVALQLLRQFLDNRDFYNAFGMACEAEDANWQMGEADKIGWLVEVISGTVPRLTNDLCDAGDVDKAIQVWNRYEAVMAHSKNPDGELKSASAAPAFACALTISQGKSINWMYNSAQASFQRSDEIAPAKPRRLPEARGLTRVLEGAACEDYCSWWDC